MGVELHSAHPLAGSETINSTTRGESATETPLSDPDVNADRDGTPKRRGRGPAKRLPPPRPLVVLCGRCSHVIAGSGAGYAYVDLRAAHAALRTPIMQASWTLAHRGCAPQALEALSPYFRLWVDRIGTVDDLLDTMATLSRQPWFAGTAWGSLVRGIVADTETVHTRTEADIERNAARRAERTYLPGPDAEHGTRREYSRGCRCPGCRAANTEHNRANREAARQGLAPDDYRHGTMAGYDWYGCRCEPCKAAKSDTGRAQYAAKTASAQEN